MLVLLQFSGILGGVIYYMTGIISSFSRNPYSDAESLQLKSYRHHVVYKRPHEPLLLLNYSLLLYNQLIFQEEDLRRQIRFHL